VMENFTRHEFTSVIFYIVEVGMIAASAVVMHLGRYWCVQRWHRYHHVL